MSTIASRLLHQLDSTSDEKPSYWRPVPGDRLVGKVVKRMQIRGRFGTREALVVELDDNSHRTIVLTKVLQDAFSDVAPGWWIAAEYLGKNGNYLQYKTAKMSPEQAQEVQAQ